MVLRMLVAASAVTFLAACGQSEPAAEPAARPAAPAAGTGMDDAAKGDPRRADPALAPARDKAHDADDGHDHGPNADHTH